LKIDPNNVDAINGKGCIQISMGNYKKAIPFFDRGLKIDPGNIQLLMNKGFALEELGELEKAQIFYDAASGTSNTK
jgi:Flp pilus assembly protein TadD